MKARDIHIGNEISSVMNHRGLKQAELARRVGMPPQNILRYLRNASVHTSKLVDFCNVLDYDFFNLYRVVEDVTPVVDGNVTGNVAAVNNGSQIYLAGGDLSTITDVNTLHKLLAEKERLIQVLLAKSGLSLPS